MKQLFKNSLYFAAALLLAGGVSSCSDDNGDGPDPVDSEQDLALKQAVEDYVDYTVIATYNNLADAAMELEELCAAMLEKWGDTQVNAGMTAADIQAACDKWKEARLHWELSEAFLFGAAAEYNIDPHIDSWPLDGTTLQTILDTPAIMSAIEEDPSYAGANFGYGLLGFHALEYMLFENGGIRALDKYTRAQLVFTEAVAVDLRDQCVLLEASWAGMDNISADKASVLEEAELEPATDFGWSMKNPGVALSRYVSYTAAAEEILQGAIDIATEVGSQKIGRPAINGEESYVESPYSRNSQTDFADNIRSIQNAYQGSRSGDASISAYVKSIDSDLDTRCRNAIATAISKIESAKGPFVLYFEDSSWDDAAEYCASDLVNVLEEVQAALTK